jgi:hypothetical protein
MVQREAAAFGWVFPFCRVILRRPVERKRSRRYKRQEFMCQTLPILEHRPKCPVCFLLRRWRESNGVYGLEAMSMKLATFFLSFARSSSCRYIIWPAS